ncbi:uncharacterized protein [Periplaneta americana]
MFSSLRKARNELQTLGIKELSISQVPAKLRMSSLKTVSKVNTCLTSTPNGKIEEKNEEKSPHFSPISINFNKQCRTVSDVTTDRIESQSALSHPGQCVSIQVIGKSDNDVNTETSVHPELIEEYNSDLPCNDIQLVSADWQNEDESKFRKLSLPADVINLVPDTSVSNIFASLESSDSKVARDVSRHGEYSESMTEVSCVKNRSTKSDYHCDSIVNTSDTNNVDKLNEDSDVKLQESEKDFKKSSSSDSFLGFSSVSDAQSSYHIPESSRLEFSESDMMNIKSANERELVAAENVTQDCKSEVNESALNSVVMPIHLSNLVLIDSNCDFENSIDCIESSIGPECNRNLALSISCNQSEMNQERVKESSIQDGTSFNLSEVPLILRIDSLQIVNREKSRVQGQLCESNIKQTMSPLVPNVDHILHSSDLRTSDCHHFKVARQSCQYSKEENSVHNTLCDLSDLPLIHVRDSVRNFNREKSLAQECEVISVQDEQLCEGNIKQTMSPVLTDIGQVLGTSDCQDSEEENPVHDTSFDLSDIPLIHVRDSLQIFNREKSHTQECRVSVQDGQLYEGNIKQTMSPVAPHVDQVLDTPDSHNFNVTRQSCQDSEEGSSVHVDTSLDLSDIPLMLIRDSVQIFNREELLLAQESVQDGQLCEGNIMQTMSPVVPDIDQVLYSSGLGTSDCHHFKVARQSCQDSKEENESTGNAIFRKPASIDHNTSLERKRSLRRLSCRRRSHVVIPSHVQEELQQCSPSFRDVYHVPTNIYTTKCRRNIIASPIEEDEEEEVSLTEESFVHEPEFFTARSAVLQRCNQKNPVPFSVAYPPSYWSTCTKIGEGVYGEVFMSEGEDKSVLKIIPIEGDCLVNGEPQKKFEEILSEIVIAMELSNLRSGKENSTHSFSEMKRCSCVQGEYPKQLINLWDEYNENKGSENDSPSMFREDQLYIILELANGGRDLEAYHFNNAAQSHSIFVQTAFALAVAEMALEFEHRDLHWGNVLISETVQKTVVFRICGQEFSVPTKGVQVTIIDFTLSRMSYDGCCIYNDLSKDPTLFTAVGDYQFEIYRLMRDSVQDKWDIFKPFTNILWLHYLLEKMCTLVNYRRKSTRLHKQGIEELKKLYKVVLDHQSATDFVLSNLVE